ncbi:acylphosphatase [Chitinophaga sp. Cy-1792]|uniref:acylphosphatase n=1 Tax=Chitinophaga sp. Cy-1792 TaxID=2608339 RepID=UPI00141F0491|nr:acylphosphatase [Chitinophaga sp. Cy-1792]NIG57721.1 acylphosphatase [Chitinophaga sp. Cy-1792]
MTNKLILHKEINVKGRVHGVGYRANAKHVADLLGVQGTVKNLLDGSVWIVAEGSEEAMNTFLEWCRKGPSHSEVKEVVIIAGEVEDLQEFLIVY